jgi:O-antigen/teichoic acid export membrane protein
LSAPAAIPVGRSVLIYAAAFAAAGATPFLLLPVLTQRLSPQDFGVVTSFLMAAALLGSVVSLSAHGFVAVRFFKTPAAGLPGLVGTSLAAMVLAHLVALGAIAALLPLVIRAFDLPARYALLVVPAALFVNLNLVWLSIFQAAGQPMRYLKARLVQSAFEIGLCLLLLRFVATDPGARIESYVAAVAASASLGAAWCWRDGRWALRFEKHSARELLAFGLPLLPHIAAGTAIVYLDRLVVSSSLGTHSLGIYMAAMQLGMVMVAIIEPLNKALAPWLFGQLARPEPGVRERIVRLTYRLHLALAAAGVALALGLHALFDRLVGHEFAPAKALLPWMLAGFVLQGMYYSVVNYLFYAERTGRLSLASGCAVLVGLGVSVTLTSSLGLMGAGISFVVNNAILLILVWVMAARAVPMPWWPLRF